VNLTDRYLDCWNESDPPARRKLVDDLFAPDVVYTDPMVEAHGVDAVDATIAAVQTQFPDFVFSPIGPVDTHHNQLRFSWGLGPAGADPVVEGFDVIVTDEDGRITDVLGFLDKIPG